MIVATVFLLWVVSRMHRLGDTLRLLFCLLSPTSNPWLWLIWFPTAITTKVYTYYRLWMSVPIVLPFQGASWNHQEKSLHILPVVDVWSDCSAISRSVWTSREKVYKYYRLWMSGPIVLPFQGASWNHQEKSIQILPVVDVWSDCSTLSRSVLKSPREKYTNITGCGCLVRLFYPSKERLEITKRKSLQILPVVDVWSDCSTLSRSVLKSPREKYTNITGCGCLVRLFYPFKERLEITKRKVYKYYRLWMSGPIVLPFQGASWNHQEKSLQILPFVDVWSDCSTISRTVSTSHTT